MKKDLKSWDNKLPRGPQLSKTNCRSSVTCFPEMLWFGLLIWKEIHLLIDWCIFWNKAADWFTHGLIAIYVTVSTASCWAIKSCKTGVHSPNTRLRGFDQDQDNFAAALQRANQIIYLKEGESLSILTFMLVFSRKDEYFTSSSCKVKHAAFLMHESFVSLLYNNKASKMFNKRISIEMKLF